MNDPEAEKKLEFLNRLLEKNEALRMQYNEFVSEKNTDDSVEYDLFIAEHTDDFITLLENLDLHDPDWENYIPRHSGYVEDWEVMEHLAEEMVGEVSEGIRDEIIGYFEEGRTDLAMLCLVSATDAFLRAEIDEDGGVFFDTDGLRDQEIKQLHAYVTGYLDTIVFSNRHIFTFTKELFRHFNEHHREDEYYLRFFEPLLLAQARDRECCEYMERTISELNIPPELIPILSTTLYKALNNKEKWLETAVRVVEIDKTVARELMEEYYQRNYNDFLKTAVRLWKADKFRWELGNFIFDRINQDKSPEFYKEVLIWLTQHEKSISQYKLLRKILTDSEKEEMLQENILDHGFYTKMLKVEGRNRDILEFIKKNRDSLSFNYMIPLIFDEYPDESFQILKNKIEMALENERGRSVYRQIVEWLKLASQIEASNEKLKQLIHQLYTMKPALPALKDEMRQAGIIHVSTP